MSGLPNTPQGLDAIGEGMLPGHLGISFTEAGNGEVGARLHIEKHHLAPNGYLHAATIVAVADTACGYGCMTSLPEGAIGFTTIELKANFLGSQTKGTIVCQATLVHGGRTTQLWDAVVSDQDSGRRLALFRCTQLLIRPAS